MEPSLVDDIKQLLVRVIYSVLIAVMVGLFTGIHSELGLGIIYVCVYWGIVLLEHKAGKRKLAEDLKQKAMDVETKRLDEELKQLDTQVNSK